MMVSIRHNPNNSSNRSTFRVTLYAAILATFGLTAIYLFSNPSTSSLRSNTNLRTNNDNTATSSIEEVMSPQQVILQSQSSTSSMIQQQSYERDEDIGNNPLIITQGNISYIHPTTKSSTSLSYYHCGPTPNTHFPTNNNNITPSQLILLHGAAFTKEDWKTSGILQQLCEINNDEDGGDLSISALDLSVKAEGEELLEVLDVLIGEGVLWSLNDDDGEGGGGKVVIVTPSASGKAMTTLVQDDSTTDNNSNYSSSKWKSIIGGWVAVASGSVLKTPDETLHHYTEANIPILAIHGDQDAMGQKVTKRLVEVTGARGVELEGRHPVYLDSPDEFCMELLRFMEENGL